VTALLVGLCAVVGLAIGSFLNVVIWRVPRGESVVSPPSACPSCGHAIAPRDNVPVVSWLLLGGQCRHCHERISARYPLVEAGTAVLFVVAALRFGFSWELPAFLYLAAITVALTMIDIDVHRLPNAIVLPSYVVAGVLLVGAALLQGNPGTVVRLGLAALALYAFYVLLAFIYPAGMGFGDVKLAGVLGLYLGYLGWAEVVVGGFLGFLVGGLGGALLMVLRRAGRKSKIPFGPYMLVGAWIAVLAGGPLVDWYLRLTGLR
jgi:leader peptidase (prepilin peptidase)/N-methyltransferase